MKPVSAPAFLACIWAAVSCLAWVATEAEPRGLTRATLEEAIAFGATHEPQPYLLRHVGDSRNPIVVGAAYTPFLRVAFLSRAAASRGEPLDPDSVADAITEPLVYIAFRWYCCEQSAGDPEASAAFAAREPAAVMLPSGATAAFPWRGVVGRGLPGVALPTWARPGAGVLAAFGAPPTHDDIALVAAFPLDSLTPNRRFAVYKDSGTRANVRIGMVRADVVRWR